MAEPERRRRAGLVVALALALGAAACSGDDDEGGDSTPTTESSSTATSATSSTSSTSASSTTTTDVTTIVQPTSTSSTPPPPTQESTTSIPPWGTGEMAEQVDEAWVTGRRLEADLLRAPTLDSLEDRVAAFALPGSEYYEGVIDRVRQLVADGLRFAPNDPSFDGATVEGVHFDGAPFTSAVVTACEVSNDVLVSVADGQPIDPGFAGQLNTYREEFRMALSDRGWVRESLPTAVLGEFQGQQTCPPES